MTFFVGLTDLENKKMDAQLIWASDKQWIIFQYNMPYAYT